MFVTNPLGAKLEQQIAEEGGRGGNDANINRDWDGVWHVALETHRRGVGVRDRDSLGDASVPGGRQSGVGPQPHADIRRKNEQVFWAPIPKGYGLTRVSFAGTLSGLSQVSRGMDLRITPYALVGGRQDRVAADLDGSGINDFGLDAKYGVTSGLNLDLTLNTDFAQVEVDEQQVNLTRFPLFFPESGTSSSKTPGCSV